MNAVTLVIFLLAFLPATSRSLHPESLRFKKKKMQARCCFEDHFILALLSFFFSGGIISFLSGHTPSLLDGLVPDWWPPHGDFCISVGKPFKTLATWFLDFFNSDTLLLHWTSDISSLSYTLYLFTTSNCSYFQNHWFWHPILLWYPIIIPVDFSTTLTKIIFLISFQPFIHWSVSSLYPSSVVHFCFLSRFCPCRHFLQ